MSRHRFPLAGATVTVLAILAITVCSIVGGETEKAEEQNPVSADRTSATSREQTPEEAAAALIPQLGDDSYEVRSETAEKLAAIGLPARQALLAGLKSSDLEVKRSCRRILADVLEADYERRLRLFINDQDGTGGHELPGWDRYREVVGKDDAARELFVQMQREEGGLLESYEAGKDATVHALETRFAQVSSSLHNRFNNQIQKPSRGTVAALMFVASDPEREIPKDITENAYWHSIIQQSPLQKTLSERKPSPERKLFGIWLMVPGSPSLMQRKLTMACQLNAPEGLELAIKLAEQKENIPTMYRAIAVAGIGQLGGKRHAARLLPFLKDDTVCMRQTRRVNGKNIIASLELRDVALAWLVHLTGQDQGDYHRPAAKTNFERMKKYPHYALNVNNLFFSEEKDRKAAFAKWEKWYANNPLPKAPEPGQAIEQPRDAEAAEENDGGNPPGGAAGIGVGGAAPVIMLARQRALAAAGAPGAFLADEQDEEGKGGAQLQRADRQDVQKVLRAARLMEDRLYADAAALLGEVLEQEDDYTYQPDRSVPLQRGLKIEAERLLDVMPQEGRAAYRLVYEPSAAKLLAEAVQLGDEQRLIDVMRRYFHTEAGAEATYLLGTHYLDSGHALRAAFCLDRLRRRSHDRDHLEPALSLKLAVCLGLVGYPREAEQVLVELKDSQRLRQVDLAGARRDVFGDRGEAVAWLEDATGTTAGDAVESGWSVYRGDASRNMTAPNGNPYLVSELLSSIVDDDFVRRKIALLQQEMIDDYQAQLPSLHPLAVDDTILLRTATAIRALDFESGKLNWEVPLIDALRHLIEHHDDKSKQRYADFVEQGLRVRLWKDATFGTMSTDGRLLFGIEETPFGLGGDYRRLVVMPDGRRRLDPGTQKSYNLLTAYDVRTGKIRWEAGGTPGISGAPLEGAFFLGPPLPMGGRLYAVAEIDDSVRLVEMDAETGKPVWQLGLADRIESKTDVNQAMLLAQMGLLAPQQQDRTSGASPSSADGVLVCPLSDDEYAAVDLTTRSVMWLYTTRAEMDDGLLRGGLNVVMQRKLLSAARDVDDRWADSTVTIAGDAVLLTPMNSDRLFCLGLNDGDLRWTAPRKDGFYIGGVQDDRVLIVGRGHLRALRVSDGKPAWDAEQVPLPPGAVPSGRGFLGQQRYYLPLSSGEVAQYEIAQGRLLSRSRTGEGFVPGNLVRYRGAVLSQGVDGLRRFETIDGRLKPLELALTDRPDDPGLLLDYGEALLFNGRVIEAIDRLVEAHRIKPSARSSRLLAMGLIEGLRLDYDRFAELSREFEPAKSIPEYVWFHKQRALALQQAGRRDDAFAALLKLIDAMPEPDKMVRVEHRREVSNRRWVAARLDELRSTADDAQRAAIDRMVSGELENREPQQFLTYFSRHPLADEARLRLARADGEKGDTLLADIQLRRLLAAPADAHRAEAIARLFGRLRNSGRSLQAYPFVQALQERLSDVVCLDGKTGRQLAAAIPSSDAVFRDPTSYWPAESVAKKSNNTRRGINFTYPVTVQSLGGRFATELSLEVDQSGRNVVGLDALGRKRLEYNLPQNVGNYIGGSLFTYARAFVIGDFAVAWLGNRVCAFDLRPPKGKLLWSEQTVDVQNNGRNPAIAMMFMRLRMPRQVNGMAGADPIPLAVTSDAVFFQELDKLKAVDLLTGKLLWCRDHVAEHSDLIAGPDRLLVQEQDEPDALVLSTLDGRLLGRRNLGDASRRISSVDGRLLMWNDAPQGMVLELIDAWSGDAVWRRKYSAEAKTWLVSHDRVAVLDDHSLEIVATSDGQVQLTAALAHTNRPESIVVTPSYGGYLVAVNEAGDRVPNIFGQQLAMTSAEVHGQQFAIDAQGKTLWKAKVTDQMIRVNQPSLVPVVTLLNELYLRENNRTRRYYEMICLDRRTGAELHKAKEQNKSNRQFVIDANLEKKTVQLQSQAGTVTFTFSDQKPE